jgi:electron transport complex protein RnfE
MNMSDRPRDSVLTGWQARLAPLQLLGICPLLAASTTLINGAALGFATLIVACASNLLIAVLRRWFPQIGLPTLLVVIAAFSTAVALAYQALFYELYLAFGVFLLLVPSNATILTRAVFASDHSAGASLLDALSYGGGMAGILILIGGIRELLAHTGLLSDTAGALFALAVLVALCNVLLRRETRRSTAPSNRAMTS